MKKLLKNPVISIYIALLILVVIFSFMSPTFFTLNNILTILKQSAPKGVMAIGAMFVMLTGGVDLSVGAEISLTGIVMATMMAKMQTGIIPAVLAAFLIGGIVGLINATLVVKINIPPMIATMGTSWILQGISYTICGGLPITGLTPGFSNFGQGSVGIIPIPVIVFAIVVAIGAFVLKYMPYGRHIYSVGSNAEATRLAGINVTFVRMSVFVICSLLTALAAIITLSRVNSGQPSTGIGQEMDVLTAVVLGGTRFTGGEGKVSGVVAGIIVIGVISNGLVMIGAGEYIQTIVKGAILILALVIYTIRARVAANAKARNV